MVWGSLDPSAGGHPRAPAVLLGRLPRFLSRPSFCPLAPVSPDTGHGSTLCSRQVGVSPAHKARGAVGGSRVSWGEHCPVFCLWAQGRRIVRSPGVTVRCEGSVVPQRSQRLQLDRRLTRSCGLLGVRDRFGRGLGWTPEHELPAGPSSLSVIGSWRSPPAGARVLAVGSVLRRSALPVGPSRSLHLLTAHGVSTLEAGVL